MRSLLSVILFLWMIPIPAVRGEFPSEIKPIMSIQLPAPIGGPLVVFPNLDAPEGLAIGLENGEVVLAAPAGEIAWTTKIGPRVSCPLAAGDIDGDGKSEILAVAGATEICALKFSGEILWRHALTGEVGAWKGPACADLDGDKTCEVLVSDDAGWMTCLKGNGELLWRIHSDPYRGGQCSIGDVNGDGTPEIVYGTESGRVLCLAGDGRIRWIHKGKETDKFGRSYTALADLDGDGLPEALFSSSFNAADSRVYAIHASDGKPFWDVRTILHGYGSCSIGDLNGDGRLDVLFGDRANTLYAIHGDGREIWRTTTGGRGYMFPQNLADVDGDGTVEVLAVCRGSDPQGKSFFILSGPEGKVLGEYPLPGSVGLSPVVCDIDQDGRLELIAGVPGNRSIDLYQLGGSSSSSTPWRTKRFDSARCGSVPPARKPQSIPAPPGSAEAGNLSVTVPGGEILWGENRLALSEDIPEKGLLEVILSDPLGMSVHQLISRSPNLLPNEFTVNLSMPGEHQVRAVLWDESVQPAQSIKTGSLKIHLEGINSLAGWKDKHLEEVLNEAEHLPFEKNEIALMLHQQVSVAEGNFRQISNLAGRIAFTNYPQRENLLNQVNQFRRKIRDLAVLKGHAVKSISKSLAVRVDPNPWNKPEAGEGEAGDSRPEVFIWTCQGETEHAALYVTNLRPIPADIQFRAPLGGPLALHEVVFVPQKVGEPVPDALPFLSQSHTLHCAPGETRQIWIEISARSLAPGNQTVTLELIPIGADGDRVKVPVHIETVPVNLADTPEFPLCNWANPKTIQSMTDDPNAVQRALDQGMTVWTCNGPGRSCNSQGNLVGEADWSSLEAQLKLLDPKKAILLMSGPGISAPPEVEVHGAAWRKGLQNAMRELAAFLASKGWPLSRWAYYPYDEPGLFAGVEEFARIARIAKEVCPEIQIYANPAGGVSRDNFGDLVDEVDIWAPELALLRRQPELVDFFLETKDWVWSYEAPGDVKTLLPLGYYRAQSLTAFSMGLAGTGHWVFAYSSNNDLWTAFQNAGYGDMYHDGSALVPSRRWFAFLDGAEDARFFLLLRATAEEARRRNLDLPELTEVENLLGPRLKKLIWMQWRQDDIARNIVDYEIDLQELQSIRKEAARLTLVLREKIAEGVD